MCSSDLASAGICRARRPRPQSPDLPASTGVCQARSTRRPWPRSISRRPCSRPPRVCADSENDYGGEDGEDDRSSPLPTTHLAYARQVFDRVSLSTLDAPHVPLQFLLIMLGKGTELTRYIICLASYCMLSILPAF